MTKFVALFVRDIAGAPEIVAKKTFNVAAAKDGVSFNKKHYLVDLEQPIYRKGKNFTYAFDVDKGQLTMSEGSPMPVSPKLMDLIMRQEIARQLVAGLGVSGNWMMMLLVGIIGVCGGISLGMLLAIVFHIGA